MGAVVVLLTFSWGVPVSAMQATWSSSQNPTLEPDPALGPDLAARLAEQNSDSSGDGASAFEAQANNTHVDSPRPTVSETVDPAQVDEVTDELTLLGPDARTACVDDDGSQLCARQYIRDDAATDTVDDPEVSENRPDTSGVQHSSAGAGSHRGGPVTSDGRPTVPGDWATGRVLGAVQPTAPHADGFGHCTDDHDDYFHTNPVTGSHVCRFWNTARSPYLHGFDDEHVHQGASRYLPGGRWQRFVTGRCVPRIALCRFPPLRIEFQRVGSCCR